MIIALVRLRKESSNVTNETMASAVVRRRFYSKHIFHRLKLALLEELLK